MSDERHAFFETYGQCSDESPLCLGCAERFRALESEKAALEARAIHAEAKLVLIDADYTAQVDVHSTDRARIRALKSEETALIERLNALEAHLAKAHESEDRAVQAAEKAEKERDQQERFKWAANQRFEDFVRTFAVQPSQRALAEKLHRAEADLAAARVDVNGWRDRCSEIETRIDAVCPELQDILLEKHEPIKRAAERESGGQQEEPNGLGGSGASSPSTEPPAAKPAARHRRQAENQECGT